MVVVLEFKVLLLYSGLFSVVMDWRAGWPVIFMK